MVVPANVWFRLQKDLCWTLGTRVCLSVSNFAKNDGLICRLANCASSFGTWVSFRFPSMDRTATICEVDDVLWALIDHVLEYGFCSLDLFSFGSFFPFNKS